MVKRGEAVMMDLMEHQESGEEREGLEMAQGGPMRSVEREGTTSALSKTSRQISPRALRGSQEQALVGQVG